MAHPLDDLDKKNQEERRTAKAAYITQQAIAEYGEDIGRVFATYVLIGHNQSEEGRQARDAFYSKIVTLLDNGNPSQRILVLRAMIDASEQHTKNAIQAALSNINPLY